MASVTPDKDPGKVYQATISSTTGEQVTGSIDSTTPPPVATQQKEATQSQPGIGAKIGSFLKGALNVLKVVGGGALFAVGIPVFIATVIPAVIIGAIVKDTDPSSPRGMDGGYHKSSTVGALIGLSVAADLIEIGSGLVNKGVEGLK